eukprot:3660478-Pyramimonas_sp.AAC.1
MQPLTIHHSSLWYHNHSIEQTSMARSAQELTSQGARGRASTNFTLDAVPPTLLWRVSSEIQLDHTLLEMTLHNLFPERPRPRPPKSQTAECARGGPEPGKLSLGRRTCCLGPCQARTNYPPTSWRYGLQLL